MGGGESIAQPREVVDIARDQGARLQAANASSGGPDFATISELMKQAEHPMVCTCAIVIHHRSFSDRQSDLTLRHRMQMYALLADGLATSALLLVAEACCGQSPRRSR